jgi:hypothetical protein
MTPRQTSCIPLPGLREAEIALHDGDAGPCSALRSHDHPVTFGGAEVNRTGWSELGPAFGWLAPGRLVHVVADAAYHGPALRTLPENVTWTCRIPRNAVPYSLARPAPASAAGPRTKGDRPGTPDEIAAAAGWARVTVTAYGRQESRHVAEVTCPWPGSWHTRTVRLILSRDERTASGYDLALITTDLAASPVVLVARYAARRGIEQAFADARNVLAPARPATASGAPSRSPCSCTP